MKKYKQLDDFYLEKDEEFLINDILPWRYIDQNIYENIDINYAVRFLQNELNSLLNSFINGGFSYKGFILYPFVKDISKDNINKIKRLKGIADFLNNNGYDFSNSIKKYQDKVNSRDFALILSALYQDFSLIKNKNAKNAKKSKCIELNMGSYSKNDLCYLKPLSELKYYADRNLKQYLAGFYLHGSLATKDYVKGWSDADTLAIVSKKTINEPEALLELRDKLYRIRHFFYKIDSLQHHGSMIISEYDIENYCQAYFPIPIFKYAKSFFKDDRINSLRVRDYSSEALRRLFWFVSYFRKLNIEKKLNLGSYHTKVLLHSITLFPAIYLQAKGILIYKKFSFDLAKKDFDKRLWNPVDAVSSIRKKWKTPNKISLINLISSVNPLLAYQLNSRYLDVFYNINRLNNINLRKLVVEMHALSENAWAKIKA